jgi:formylglycine-generating enzyme required for sulfatase activity
MQSASSALSAAAAAVIDTARVSKEGYHPSWIPIYEYNTGGIVDLAPLAPDSLIPPGMTHIPGGEFEMGSLSGDPDETPVRMVTLSPFFMDTTEVTRADYYALMNVRPWQQHAGSYAGGPGDEQPAGSVSWYDAVLYCNARSVREGKEKVYSYSSLSGTPGNGAVLTDVEIDYTKAGYRLPTEAEWEYAARAGTSSRFIWGDTREGADVYAWHGGNSGMLIHPVARLEPNFFGLYDVIGNVQEWVNDWYTVNYDPSEKEDPIGRPAGTGAQMRVQRGGLAVSPYRMLRPTDRGYDYPDKVGALSGFRVVLPDRR